MCLKSTFLPFEEKATFSYVMSRYVFCRKTLKKIAMVLDPAKKRKCLKVSPISPRKKRTFDLWNIQTGEYQSSFSCNLLSMTTWLPWPHLYLVAVSFPVRFKPG